MKATRTATTASHVDTVGTSTDAAPRVGVLEDPARRPDVLLRVRREDGYEPSVWWPIAAFLIVSLGVLLALAALPTGA